MSENDKVNFGAVVDTAKDVLLEAIESAIVESCIPTSDERTELRRVISEFTSALGKYSYLNGFAAAILEHRGCESFDSVVEALLEQAPYLRTSPEWEAGLESHDDVYRRGALAGFRLALKDDMTDPEYVKTKQFIQQLDSLEKQN